MVGKKRLGEKKKFPRKKSRVFLTSHDLISTTNIYFSGRARVSVAEELTRLLRLLLAEATNTQQQALCAQLTECLRCLTVFDQSALAHSFFISSAFIRN